MDNPTGRLHSTDIRGKQPSFISWQHPALKAAVIATLATLIVLPLAGRVPGSAPFTLAGILYCQGITLAHFTKRDPRFPLVECGGIFIQSFVFWVFFLATLRFTLDLAAWLIHLPSLTEVVTMQFPASKLNFGALPTFVAIGFGASHRMKTPLGLFLASLLVFPSFCFVCFILFQTH